MYRTVHLFKSDVRYLQQKQKHVYCIRQHTYARMFNIYKTILNIGDNMFAQFYGYCQVECQNIYKIIIIIYSLLNCVFSQSVSVDQTTCFTCSKCNLFL